MESQIGNQSTTTPAKVIPLLAGLSRLEELSSALVMRLDPITDHPTPDKPTEPIPNTVTFRINRLGDSLQYLLDNMEL